MQEPTLCVGKVWHGSRWVLYSRASRLLICVQSSSLLNTTIQRNMRTVLPLQPRCNRWLPCTLHARVSFQKPKNSMQARDQAWEEKNKMKLLNIASVYRAWLPLLFLSLSPVYGSPLQLNINESLSILNISAAEGQLANSTSLGSTPSNDVHSNLLTDSRPTSTALTQPRSAWPPIPFTKKSPMSLHWLHVISGGKKYNSVDRISIRWSIALLLLRLEELHETSPCPPYARTAQTGFLQLEVMRPPPSVALCKWAILTFDGLLERYGVREIVFTFGVGVDTFRYLGIFEIGFGPPMGRLTASAWQLGEIQRARWTEPAR